MHRLRFAVACSFSSRIPKPANEKRKMVIVASAPMHSQVFSSTLIKLALQALLNSWEPMIRDFPEGPPNMTVTRRKRGQAHEPHTSKFLDPDYHSPRCVLKSHLRGVNDLHSVCEQKASPRRGSVPLSDPVSCVLHNDGERP